MAIFRGTGGSGSSSDSTIVDAVTAQAGIATTKADEASTSATTAFTEASQANASAVTAAAKASEASSDAGTADLHRQACFVLRGETYDLAVDALASANAAEASATTANSSAVQTVAGSNTQVVGVYNNIANVNTVAGVNTDVTTVAGISSDVTTVAADASDIGTVSTNIANVNNVGNNIANVNAVHGNASNINTVAADGTDIGTVATNIANVNTVAGISSTVTTVAGLESKMDTVIADASDIGAVAGNIGDVTTVAGINADVDTVAGIAAKVTTVADNISDVQAADTNATNAATSASNASASATSASNSATTATTKATEASNSATAASNSATTATTKASQAAGSATNAGTSASTATTKASEASASATTATTKAGEAASSASAASGDATTATTKAAEADASATSAATSATNSSNAASTWNDFYTTYLGAADAQPTADVQGNAIVAGALYYDTGAGSNTVGLYVYNGSTWVYSTNYNNVTAPYILAQDLNANGNDIISAGKVGIGTSSPSAKVEIYDTQNTQLRVNTASHGYLDLSNYSNGAAVMTSASHPLRLGTANTERMRIDESGKVGIGTTSPQDLLHINSDTTDARLLLDGHTNFDAELKFAENGSVKYTVGHDAATDSFRIGTTNVDTNPRLVIDSSGKVGIGTANPTQELHVVSSGESDIRLQGSNSANHVDFFHNASDFGLWGTGTQQLKLATNNTERLRIDASGKVGIGTTSPVYPLVVSNSGAQGLEFIVGNTNFIQSYNRSTSDYTPLKIDAETIAFATNNGSERMRIDSSGNLRIGTVLPQTSAKFNLRRNGTNIEFGHGNRTSGYYGTLGAQFNNGQPYMGLSCDADDSGNTFTTRGFKGNALIGTTTGDLTFNQITSASASGQTPTERMRIDSSGNLLVGQTSTGDYTTTAGSSLRASGFSTHTRDGGDVLLLNRLSSPGSILLFRNDNLPVGSIGTDSNSELFISGAGNRGGLGFYDHVNNAAIRPVNSDGTLSDGDTDIGYTDSRFKDLFLSGGVHLGGTGSANKLDDYEEGTFTLNTAGDSTGVFQDTPSCRYTKIGNTVHVLIAFRIGTNFTGQNVGGLPFTANHSGMNSSFISTGVVLTSTNNTVSAAVGDLSTTVRFHDNQNTSDPHLPNTTAQYYRLNFTYQTNS